MILYAHQSFHNNKDPVFVEKKFSSPYSQSALGCLDTSYLSDSIRNFDLFKEHFVHYSECNLNCPLPDLRETLFTNDHHFHVFHYQPPPLIPAQFFLPFHAFMSQPHPATEIDFFIHLLTTQYPTL